MKYYVVFNKHSGFYGSLNKSHINLFKHQRHMDQFFIQAIDTEKTPISKEVLEDIQYNEATISYGYLIFPSEKAYMYESLDQMYMDFYHRTVYMLRDNIPFVHFTEEEFRIIERFFHVIHIALHEEEQEEPEYNGRIDKYFDEKKLIEYIIKTYGGR